MCVARAKRRATLKGLAFDIDHAYMMQLWPHTGLDKFGHKMEWKGEPDGLSIPRPESPTIDRINPRLGYVRGNVQWLSQRWNAAKGSSSECDLLAAIHAATSSPTRE